MNGLLRLYPGPWRDRYGAEFEALLAERQPSLADRVDIVRGALDAHRHPQVPGPLRVPDRFGLAPLVGFGLLVTAVVVAGNGPLQHDEYGTYREGAAALPFLVLATLLLSVGLHRVVERLPTGAFWSSVAGWAAMALGPVWAFMPWLLPVGALFLIAVLGLLVGAVRAGLVPTWSVVALVTVLAVPAGLFLAALFLPWYALRLSGIDLLVVIGPIGLLWLAVGGWLLRGFPRLAGT